jgi:hypothetical protein
VCVREEKGERKGRRKKERKEEGERGREGEKRACVFGKNEKIMLSSFIQPCLEM